MSYDDKLAMAAEMRKGTALADHFPTTVLYDKMRIRRQSANLPEGFKAVLPIAKPLDDLSHMNGKNWKTAQKKGISLGRKKINKNVDAV